MQEMLNHFSPATSSGDGRDSGAEAFARLLAFKDDADDKLALARAERDILQRRKDALQVEVRQLKSALLASQVLVAEKEKHITALKTYLDEARIRITRTRCRPSRARMHSTCAPVSTAPAVLLIRHSTEWPSVSCLRKIAMNCT